MFILRPSTPFYALYGGQGYGWNRVWLDDVTVYDDGTLSYGVTTRSNSEYYGGWFSACDFTVERIDDASASLNENQRFAK